MKGPECQTENNGFQEILRRCGTKLALTCPRCNSEYLPGDEFCGECGHKEARERHRSVVKGSLRGSLLPPMLFHHRKNGDKR